MLSTDADASEDDKSPVGGSTLSLFSTAITMPCIRKSLLQLAMRRRDWNGRRCLFQQVYLLSVALLSTCSREALVELGVFPAARAEDQEEER